MDTTWNALVKQRSWLQDLSSSLSQSIKRGDSINVWGIPSVGTSSQLRKLTQSIEQENIFISHIDTQWLSSVSSDSFFELLNTHLAELDPSIDPSLYSSLSPLIQTQKVLSQVTQDRSLCIIIDTIEYISDFDSKIHTSLKALRDKFFGKLCFVFISNRPLYDHPDFASNDEFIDFACHKDIPSTPLSIEDTWEEVQETAHYFNLSLSPKDISKIVELSGGILGLTKSILRIIESNDDVSIEAKSLLQEPSIRNRVSHICEVFTEEETAYLTCLANGVTPKTNATEFISKSGLIADGTIRSGLLKQALPACVRREVRKTANSSNAMAAQTGRVEQKGLQFDYISGEIFHNGHRLPDVLSKTETKIIKRMTDTVDMLVTRGDIAQEIWGGSTDEKYSEWAIDKTISRIRQKIGDTKRPYKYLLTIKGRGFKLYPVPE